MDGNNSKLVLVVVGAAIVAGGIFAVRNLTGPKNKDKIEVAEGKKAESGESETNIGTIDSTDTDDSGRAKSRSNSSISRGESAASIKVTPATSTNQTTQPAGFGQLTQAQDDQTTPTEEDERNEIATLVEKFMNSTDPDDRIDAADELGMIDSPESIKAILELLKNETDPEVQTSLLEAMQSLEALELTASEVLAAARDMYNSTTDPDVRIAAQDLLGDLSTPEAAQLLREMRNSPNADPSERLNAAENLMRIRAFEPDLVSDAELQDLTNQLKMDYQAGTDVSFRSQAIMALAVNGRNNVEFFQQAAQTEQDPGLKNLLDRLVRMFTSPPPATPPPGTVVTPVPTP